MVWSFAFKIYFMISLSIGILLLSTFLFYSQSMFFDGSNESFLKFVLRDSFTYSKQLAFILSIISLLGFYTIFGLTSGLILWFLILIGCFSLIVILYPTRVVSTQFVALCLVFSCLTEIVVSYACQ
jgi:membrane-bound ClpP family serine protease